MYADGYVIPIPASKVDQYRKLARLAGKVWREHGAVEYRECVADDVNTPFGLSFPKALKLKRGETVIFSWVVFKSRAHRDRVNAKVLADPRIKDMDPKSNPFDYKRMLYGGFKILVDL